MLIAASSAALSLPVATQDIPQQLQPPANEQFVLQVHAKGNQVYIFESDAARFIWTLKAPDARLFDFDLNFRERVAAEAGLFKPLLDPKGPDSEKSNAA